MCQAAKQPLEEYFVVALSPKDILLDKILHCKMEAPVPIVFTKNGVLYGSKNHVVSCR